MGAFTDLETGLVKEQDQQIITLSERRLNIDGTEKLTDLAGVETNLSDLPHEVLVAHVVRFAPLRTPPARLPVLQTEYLVVVREALVPGVVVGPEAAVVGRAESASVAQPTGTDMVVGFACACAECTGTAPGSGVIGSMTMGSIGEKIGGRCGESWWDESMVPD